MNGKNYIPIKQTDSIRDPKGELSFIRVDNNDALWLRKKDGTDVPLGGGGGGGGNITWALENPYVGTGLANQSIPLTDLPLGGHSLILVSDSGTILVEGEDYDWNVNTNAVDFYNLGPADGETIYIKYQVAGYAWNKSYTTVKCHLAFDPGSLQPSEVALGDTIDDELMAIGDIFLATSTDIASQRWAGLYIVEAGTSVRLTEYTATDGASFMGLIVSVKYGTAFANKIFHCTNGAEPSPDTDPITFEQVGNGGGGGGGMIDKTYAEINAMRIAGTLIPGQMYRITDFASIIPIAGTAELTTGPNEPLIVLANSTNDYQRKVWSVSNPADEIIYDMSVEQIIVDGGMDGTYTGSPINWAGTSIVQHGYNQITFSTEPIIDGHFYMYLENTLNSPDWRYAEYDQNNYGTDWTLEQTVNGRQINCLKCSNGGPQTLTDIAITAGFYISMTSNFNLGVCKGQITYRKDMVKNVSAPFDFRNYKVRRYYGTIYSNGAPFNLREGYWCLGGYDMPTIQYGPTTNRHNYYIKVGTGMSFFDYPLFGDYEQTENVEIQFPISNNNVFRSRCKDSFFGKNFQNTSILSFCFGNTIKGTMNNAITRQFSGNNFDSETTFSSVYGDTANVVGNILDSGATLQQFRIGNSQNNTSVTDFSNNEFHARVAFNNVNVCIGNFAYNKFYCRQFTNSHHFGPYSGVYTTMYNIFQSGLFTNNDTQNVSNFDGNLFDVGRSKYIQYNQFGQLYKGNKVWLGTSETDYENPTQGDFEYNNFRVRFANNIVQMTGDFKSNSIWIADNNKIVGISYFTNNTFRLLRDCEFHSWVNNNVGEYNNATQYIKNCKFYGPMTDNVFTGNGATLDRCNFALLEGNTFDGFGMNSCDVTVPMQVQTIQIQISGKFITVKGLSGAVYEVTAPGGTLTATQIAFS